MDMFTALCSLLGQTWNSHSTIIYACETMYMYCSTILIGYKLRTDPAKEETIIIINNN